MDHLMLNTQSMTYLHLPKRGEWSNDIWTILSFVQTFDTINITDEDNPNFKIILDSPDWDSFERDVRALPVISPNARSWGKQMIPKFRAFHDGDMLYNASKVGNALCWDDGVRFDVLAFEQDIPPVMMQFTGAKDMHGTDIYEGDIIRKEECSPDDMAFGHYGSIGAIQYDVDVMGFIVVSEDDGFYDNTGVIFSFDEIEVIGNVYENSDILELR